MAAEGRLARAAAACLTTAVLLAGCSEGLGDHAVDQLDVMRDEMLEVYRQVRPTVESLGEVRAAVGEWDHCLDQGGDLRYNFTLTLLPGLQSDEGRERIREAVAARLDALPEKPSLRFGAGAPLPDGRWSLYFVPDACVQVERELYSNRIGVREVLPPVPG